MRAHRFSVPCSLVFALLATAACSSPDAVDFGDQASVDTASAAQQSAKQRHAATDSSSSNGDAGVGATGSGNGGLHLPPNVRVGDAGALMCGNAACQCNNGLDDDGDGVVDGFDVECTGALDDDESSFATGIPGDNRDPKWQDCFFDGNSGAGDDRCRYPTGCLTGELSQSDPACATTEACRNNCAPLAPNGCDCFGCCAVQLPSGQSVDILLQDSCSLERIGDTQACPRCTQSASCGNACGECELCPGKTAADLPASCNPVPQMPAGDPDGDPTGEPSDPPAEPAAPTPTCDGRTACAAQADCSSGEFCSLGCCLAVIH